jgi:hypothetical protein
VFLIYKEASTYIALFKLALGGQTNQQPNGRFRTIADKGGFWTVMAMTRLTRSGPLIAAAYHADVRDYV